MSAPLTSQGYFIEDDELCDTCDGTGIVWTAKNVRMDIAQRCPACDGSGLLLEEL